jgi:hypothetical protein
MAVLATEKKVSGQLAIAVAEESHKKQLAAQAETPRSELTLEFNARLDDKVKELDDAFLEKDKVMDSLWEELAQEETAKAMLDGVVKKLGLQLAEANQHEATARE